MSDSSVHCKRLDSVPDRRAYVAYYERLQASGLGPRILDVDDDHVYVEKLETLRDWVNARLIDGSLPDEPRRTMGRALVELLEGVHELGFCHRDTHIRNLVVRQDVPLLVDPKYAISSHGRTCYDLFGPQESGVEIASEHLSQNNLNQYGVWWENAHPITEALTSTFGPVAELLDS